MMYRFLIALRAPPSQIHLEVSIAMDQSIVAIDCVVALAMDKAML